MRPLCVKLWFDPEDRSAPAQKKRSEFLFDAQSRMVERKDFSGWNGSGYATTNETRFVYSGWLLIYERATSDEKQTTNCYVWGLDLSGTLQGAGGIGGLLAQIRNGGTWLYTFDGNGNVTDILSTNAAVLAHYEFDPFGRVVSQSGYCASSNLWQFSTKPFDAIWGLIHYEFRPYSPNLHVWLSRDPIEEWRNANLYTFVRNAPISLYDLLGLANDTTYEGVDLGPTDKCKICVVEKFKVRKTRFTDTANEVQAHIKVTYTIKDGGKKGNYTIDKSCCLYRQKIKGVMKKSLYGRDLYDIDSAEHTINMKDWVWEYKSNETITGDQFKFHDYPGFAGLKTDDYRKLHLEFQFIVWDTCQGKAKDDPTGKATLEIEGYNAGRFKSFN